MDTISQCHVRLQHVDDLDSQTPCRVHIPRAFVVNQGVAVPMDLRNATSKVVVVYVCSITVIHFFLEMFRQVEEGDLALRIANHDDW